MQSPTSIFLAILDRMTTYQSLEESVREVSRYVWTNGDLNLSWWRFIQHCPNIPEEVLRILARSKDWHVLCTIAGRKQDLPEEVLRDLAQNVRMNTKAEKGYFRALLASRKQVLPEDVLKDLAQDEHKMVRWAIENRKENP